MRWHLIEFEQPLLAISDHPVVGWHTKADYRRPEQNATGVGVRNFLEVRVPISPKLALLMTWQDMPDAETTILGSEAIAANINAFTIANGERQWMHQPGATPPIAQGYLEPIAPTLIPGYDRDEVEARRFGEWSQRTSSPSWAKIFRNRPISSGRRRGPRPSPGRCHDASCPGASQLA